MKRWSDITEANLRRLVRSGASPEQAAQSLGTTANACLGKAHRLGLNFSRDIAEMANHVTRCDGEGRYAKHLEVSAEQAAERDRDHVAAVVATAGSFPGGSSRSYGSTWKGRA